MNILEKIVTNKKEEIKIERSKIPERDLRERAYESRKKISLVKALEKPGQYGVNIIAEIKRASPSKGPIRPDLDPALYAESYAKGKAAAISVLTDKTYFMGTPDDLSRAKKAVSLPILRKEFIISAYQIYQSCALGADAVLLIARILSKDQLKDYVSLCNEVNIDVLVEIHSEKELDTVFDSKAQLVGINNRNLETFSTDIETSIRLASYLEFPQIPVAESGIGNREDVEKLTHGGVWNFLIGESLVRATDPCDYLQRLMGVNSVEK